MNESKSQHWLWKDANKLSCYKYQNINERKQITTLIAYMSLQARCYKYQNINERKQITTC